MCNDKMSKGACAAPVTVIAVKLAVRCSHIATVTVLPTYCVDLYDHQFRGSDTLDYFKTRAAHLLILIAALQLLSVYDQYIKLTGDPGAHFKALDPDEQAEVLEWQSKEPALRSAVVDKLRSAVLRESPQRRSTPFVMVKVCCSCCCDAKGDAPVGAADVANDVAGSSRVTRRAHRRCAALLRLWEPNESVVQLLQEGRCALFTYVILHNSLL
jgi:hypothetical protein